jgi:hypothetical protein
VYTSATTLWLQAPCENSGGRCQLERQARDEENAGGSSERRDEIDPERGRADRNKARDAAEQHVERVAGGVGNAERRGSDEEITGILAVVPPRDGRRQGGRVDPERGQGGNPGGAAGVAGHARQANRGVKVGQRDLPHGRSRASGINAWIEIDRSVRNAWSGRAALAKRATRRLAA